MVSGFDTFGSRDFSRRLGDQRPAAHHPNERSGRVEGRRLALIVVAASLVLELAWSSKAFAGPFVFGLDNRPRAPISIDPPGFGNSAEDPFGLVINPILTGPSPSLAILSPGLGRTLSDADILFPGPAAPQANTARPLNTNYVDAISSNQASVDGSVLRLAFSVDRASRGAIASDVRAQFLLNQHPGDIFISARDFPAPSQFVGTTLGFGWFGNLSSTGLGSSNQLLLNQSALALTAGAGPGNLVDSTVLAPPIMPGSHDNVDAFDMVPPDSTGDFVGDMNVYYSVNPDQPVLNPVYASAADLYRTTQGSQVPALFASALAMGLDGMGPNSDDVDALVLYDLGTPGVLDPGVDYALFSLSPGSRSLVRPPNQPQLTAADIFFTDFRQSFATFATDADLGLSGTIFPAELEGMISGNGSSAGLGTPGTDNVDGLGSYALGDMDWNGTLNLQDVDDFVQGVTRPDDYRDLNLDHFGQPATILGDFSVPRDGLVDFDDIPPFRNVIEGSSSGSASSAAANVPEPALACLAAIALAGLREMRRRGAREGGNARHHRARTGYTMIELLVVITIIGVLLALLLPAIQAAREATRSTQCSYHLKQLVLAMHAYHDSHNHFPPGSSLAFREEQPGHSWHVYCLPYLEEHEVADRILKHGEALAPAVPIFFCPSDPVVTGGADQRHLTSYAGSSGAGKDLGAVIDLEDKFCGDIYTDGIFYPLSETDDDSVTDGLTHTLAIGERTYVKHVWADGAFWVGSAEERQCQLAMKNIRWPINSPVMTAGYYVFDANAPTASLRTLRMNDLYFGSRHRGGAWFAFAGGNVQFIAEEIAFTVYQDLATRNGGENQQQ